MSFNSETDNVYMPYVQSVKTPISIESKYTSRTVNEPSDREERIGDVIKNIFVYADYFSPIVETRKVHMGMLGDADGADFVPSPLSIVPSTSTNLRSVTTRNIGTKTLFQHIDTIKNNGSKINVVKTLIISHLHILRGIARLQEADIEIVHFNMGVDSVVYDDVRGAPVIIDYSLSFLISDIQSRIEYETEKKMFIYESLNEYIRPIITVSDSIRCLDVALICHIVNVIVPRKSLTSKIDFDAPLSHEHITELIEISTTFTNALMVASDKKDEFSLEWTKFITYLGTIPLYSALDGLIRGWKFWDIYSVSVIYKTQLMRLFGVQSSTWLNDYLTIMDAIILSYPHQDSYGEWKREEFDITKLITTKVTSIAKNDAMNLHFA